MLLGSEALACALRLNHAKYFQNKHHAILGSHIITALLGRELVKWKLWDCTKIQTLAKLSSKLAVF